MGLWPRGLGFRLGGPWMFGVLSVGVHSSSGFEPGLGRGVSG